MLIDTLKQNIEKDWTDSFECWYLFWVLSLREPEHLPKNDHELKQYKKLKEDFNKAQLGSILTTWREKQNNSLRVFKAKGNNINSLFNKKGSKGQRRNSLRTIIRGEFDLFTDFFPVLLLNPSVCSSIIPLQEGIFDIVIFDEASQIRLEDTYAALIRGKAKIVSGDKHQMAPSSYFEGSGAMLDPVDDLEDDNEQDDVTPRHSTTVQHIDLANSESLLAYAENRGFKQSYLDIHYRSQHPHLIDFSNNAFYGKRLIPIPAKQDYKPIQFLQIDGIYEGQTNKLEALEVVSILKRQINPLPDGSYPSVGVATFNIYQRNLILEEIAKTRQEDRFFDALMIQLGESFFVKNLENIQGDERDIIILSTTFGRKNDGSFTQSFGPIIQSKGHRMLNVIITRAKVKVFICTSIPQEYIMQYTQLLQKNGNLGRGVLYAYFAYAKAVSDGNEGLRLAILNTLSQYCFEKNYENQDSGVGSESIFEDEVRDRLALKIGEDRIEQQFKIGGFRVDMIIRHKHSKQPLIIIECDGAKYHSSNEAYAWDVFRQEQLEQYGFIFYRIWSTKWWDAPEQELDKLVHFINQCDEVK